MSSLPNDSSRLAQLARYRQVRNLTAALAAPLSPEDQCIQSMPDASPTKWHLAHTTWFFETLVLTPLLPGYRPFDRRFGFLFNSYYESAGPRQPRPRRGLISRPDCAEVRRYRHAVDAAMADLIGGASDEVWRSAEPLVELGLQHEQQHQELLLTDILHALAQNPFDPAYRELPASRPGPPPPLDWLDFAGGVVSVGHAGDGFAFDNESPRHATLLTPYHLANRLVAAGEYLEFMADGGYRRPEFWLSDGWTLATQENWQAPLYWRDEGNGRWTTFGLAGRRPVDLAAPVCHVSFYEASAYAAWRQARLPTEFEWEAAAADLPVTGNFLDPDIILRPLPAPRGHGLLQAFGDVWEWTRSSYDPYPGYRPWSGVASEYNGKFMVGQLVLRGGSCVTAPGHVRPSYRNFFPPAARWQFSGIRLARH